MIMIFYEDPDLTNDLTIEPRKRDPGIPKRQSACREGKGRSEGWLAGESCSVEMVEITKKSTT
jgi:hypothetical protein